MAEALTRGHVDDAAITAADDALQRAGRLAVTHGMQKLTARFALTGVLLDALREDPAGRWPALTTSWRSGAGSPAATG